MSIEYTYPFLLSLVVGPAQAEPERPVISGGRWGADPRCPLPWLFLHCEPILHQPHVQSQMSTTVSLSGVQWEGREQVAEMCLPKDLPAAQERFAFYWSWKFLLGRKKKQKQKQTSVVYLLSDVYCTWIWLIQWDMNSYTDTELISRAVGWSCPAVRFQMQSCKCDKLELCQMFCNKVSEIALLKACRGGWYYKVKKHTHCHREAIQADQALLLPSGWMEES